MSCRNLPAHPEVVALETSLMAFNSTLQTKQRQFSLCCQTEYGFYHVKNVEGGIGEAAQRLRPCAALSENPFDSQHPQTLDTSALVTLLSPATETRALFWTVLELHLTLKSTENTPPPFLNAKVNRWGGTYL